MEVGRLERFAQPQGSLAGVAQRGARQNDGEFLSSITGYQVHVAHAAAQKLGDAPQHLVAGLMSVRVVEPREDVHVGHDQGESSAVPGELGAAAGKLVVEGPAIGQQREGASARASAAWA